MYFTSFFPSLSPIFLPFLLQQKPLFNPHGATYSYSFLVFTLDWQKENSMRLQSNCCLLPLQPGLPTHRLLSMLVKRIKSTIYYCRRTGGARFTCLQTIRSHPAFPKCFLLIIKPCESKQTLNMPDLKGSLTVNGETCSIKVKNYMRLSTIIAVT